MRNTDPVTKVTILPRGRALGYTMVLPLEDKYSVTRHELLDQLTYAIGGRVAEEVVFHDPPTGATNGIDKATSNARRLVPQNRSGPKVAPDHTGPGTTRPKLTAWHSSQTQSAWAGSCRGRAYLAAGRAGSSGDADSEQLDNEANVVHQAAALHPR